MKFMPHMQWKAMVQMPKELQGGRWAEHFQLTLPDSSVSIPGAHWGKLTCSLKEQCRQSWIWVGQASQPLILASHFQECHSEPLISWEHPKHSHPSSAFEQSFACIQHGLKTWAFLLWHCKYTCIQVELACSISLARQLLERASIAIKIDVRQEGNTSSFMVLCQRTMPMAGRLEASSYL